MYCTNCTPMSRMEPKDGGFVCPDCKQDVDAKGYKREKGAVVFRLPECEHEMMPESGCPSCDAWVKENSRTSG